MQTIGLLGGMSWESTLPYYRTINEAVRDALGGLHSASIVLNSVDFHEIERLQDAGDWARAGEILADAARSVEAGGADFLVLCTNTMHKVAPAITRAVTIPLLHIADPTAAAIVDAGLSSIGLLGTRFTMEQDFYRDRLAAHGITAIVPDDDERECIHRVIYDELCRGVVRDASRVRYRSIIGRLVERGARGIVLGCTEIAMLIDAGDVAVPLFDTALLHARAAAMRALTGESRRLAHATAAPRRHAQNIA
ncbi:MAG TPA: aspartate/glutamate racemase family protein [Casimicrobiaceae bacterium]|nr:aspartate/glutamate racemase family protein [Casimicrobiaceae bacterium]